MGETGVVSVEMMTEEDPSHRILGSQRQLPRMKTMWNPVREATGEIALTTEATDSIVDTMIAIAETGLIVVGEQDTEGMMTAGTRMLLRPPNQPRTRWPIY